MLRIHLASDPDDHAVPIVSRRRALRSLGGLALAAAGAAALGPAALAAKPKRKGKKSPRPSGGQRAVTPRGGVGDVVVGGIGDPPVVEPGDPIVEFSQIIDPRLALSGSGRKRTVRVTATIVFSEEDLQGMRAGKTSRLSCEIWENDDDAVHTVDEGADTFLFGYPGKTFPSGNGQPVDKVVTVAFEKSVSKDVLDTEVSADEIIGLLVLTTASGRLIRGTTNLVKFNAR